MPAKAQSESEKVYCIIPTHNRINKLTEILGRLKRQSFENIQIVVVDDGSSDGTKEYLQRLEQENLSVLNGNGKLWWGGAVAKGIEYVLNHASEGQYILLLNDDSIIGEDYIEKMVGDSLRAHGATVVSPQYNVGDENIAMTGYRISFKKKEITQTAENEMDATVGRGLLVPISTVRAVGNINYRLFRHYMGDVEYTARIKEKGLPLVVSKQGKMYTDLTESDLEIRKRGNLASMFHPRSKVNYQDRFLFFIIRGPIRYRITTLPVMLFGIMSNGLGKLFKN